MNTDQDDRLKCELIPALLFFLSPDTLVSCIDLIIKKCDQEKPAPLSENQVIGRVFS